MVEAPDAGRTLSPLPTVLHDGIIAVTTVAFVSLILSAGLVLYLLYRLITWKHRAYARINQYVLLLLNLIVADLQQSIGFCLGADWLRQDGIFALTPTCWTQGWFLNAGDVASAVFTLAIAAHLFADVVFDKRLGYAPFVMVIIALWTFTYFLSTIGVVVHPDDFYMRAGPWCWIPEKYMHERLWFHYLWIILTEFSVVVVYALMFMILWRRVNTFFYATPDTHLRAESAARSIVAYPIAYVICTLPAVITRLRIMAGGKAEAWELVLIGVTLASNGWLDVLLYTISRRTLIFGPAIADSDVAGLDTFTIWTQPEKMTGKIPLGDHDQPRCTHRIDSTIGLCEAGTVKQGVTSTSRDPPNMGIDAITPISPGAISSHGRQLRSAQSFASFERTCPSLEKLEEI